MAVFVIGCALVAMWYHVGSSARSRLGVRHIATRLASYFLATLIVTNSNNQRRVSHISHDHKGWHPKRGEAYKILYPLGTRPTPSGCTGINQSEEWKPSNMT